MRDTLFDEIAVCCIFCAYIIRTTTPEAAHALMEDHYSEKHQAQIDGITGTVRR